MGWGWRTLGRWVTRISARAWRESRRTRQQLGALDQTLNRLGVLYALDLQTRGVPTGTLLDEFAQAARYVLPEPVAPTDLATTNQDLAAMRDEDFADLEALDQYGWSDKSPEEREAFLEQLRAFRTTAADMPRVHERAARGPQERAYSQGTSVPFFG